MRGEGRVFRKSTSEPEDVGWALSGNGFVIVVVLAIGIV